MTTTEKVSTTEMGRAVKAKILTDPADQILGELSAAKAEPRKPASVMPIWMVERKPAGCSSIFSSLGASLSPLSSKHPQLVCV